MRSSMVYLAEVLLSSSVVSLPCTFGNSIQHDATLPQTINQPSTVPPLTCFADERGFVESEKSVLLFSTLLEII